MNQYIVFKLWRKSLFVVLATSLLAIGSSYAQNRFRYSGDGSEVIDAMTGLTWQRCTQGQTWDGETCVGNAKTYTFEQTGGLVTTQGSWRLPTLKELFGLIDFNRETPSIDTTAFPNTKPMPYWSSTKVIGDADVLGSVWSVNFYAGNARFSKDLSVDNYVRLVR
jgi:hypothetical protein